ncbi:MAG: hypothetical protein JRF63_12770 [Deltaproteobacteria bacterium]|nr:hypothetical protein [Deltaproteobacteria bacterium]
MRTPNILILASLHLIANGCTVAPDAPETNPGTAPAEAEPVAPQPTPSPEPVAEISVPAISIARTSPDAEQRAETLNLQGMTAYNANNYAAAIAQFVAALEANPAAHQTRYNLACALALSGDGRGALEQLEQLKNANCTPCRQNLDRARFDKDLAILRGHPGFEAIVAD